MKNKRELLNITIKGDYIITGLVDIVDIPATCGY
jgi:hypothetical protein